MQTRYLNAIGMSLVLLSASILFNAGSANAAVFIAKADMTEIVDNNETELLVYPGAVRATNDECLETSANGSCKKSQHKNVKIDFAIGEYGIKLIATKWQSRDSTTDIAAFYQRELARFGSVLDCSQANAKRKVESSEDEDNTLTCDSRVNRVARKKLDESHSVGQRSNSSHHYRVGTKDNQRIVAINQKNGVNEIQLVYVNARLPEWMKSSSKTSISVSP